MFDVLYIEDERSSIRLVEEAFAESEVSVRLHAVQTGSEALDILGCDHAGASVPRPDLVLLDLDLVECTGFEVLERVKDRPELCSIPVVVFTSSGQTTDIETAYECGANAYVQKPGDFGDLMWMCPRLRRRFTQTIGRLLSRETVHVSHDGTNHGGGPGHGRRADSRHPARLVPAHGHQ